MAEFSWIGVALVLVVGIGAGVDAIRDHLTPDPGIREYVHGLYLDDKIDEDEMERRLAVIEDPAADRIREATERVSGIGEQTSWDIAARFDTLDDVREADMETLTDVPNVGEKRAQVLRDQL